MIERSCRIKALKPLMPCLVLNSLALSRNLFYLEGSLPNTFDAVRRFVQSQKFLMESVPYVMESVLFMKNHAIIQKKLSKYSFWKVPRITASDTTRCNAKFFETFAL